MNSKERTAHQREGIPEPAHPHRRQEPLPWHQPKSAEEDPEAAAHVKAIPELPSYRAADDDAEFLRSDELRGVRLQLDYEKAELLLAKHCICHTIVVFGGTRICEPATAQ